MYFRFFFVLLLMFCVSNFSNCQSDKGFFRKDYDYSNGTKSFYKIHTIPKIWAAAELKCAQEGASLFYPEDGAEAKEVVKYWKSKQPTFDKVFVGVTNLITKGVYETIDGRPLIDVFHKWAPGQPNGNTEDCVVFIKDTTFHNYPCSAKFPHICKKTFASLAWNYECNIPVKYPEQGHNKNFYRNDYHFINETQSLYKIHALPMKWHDAKRRCALEGASFFHPQDDAEAQVVLEYWKATHFFPHIFVGASDLIVKGVYETIHGLPIRNVYHNWLPGKPGNDNEDCIILHNGGSLQEYSCSSEFPFICKKDNKSMERIQQDYNLNGQLGKCYKLHKKPLTWSEAHGLCSAEQSYLAIVNSEAEADYLATLAKSAPEAPVTGNFLNGSVLLGFNNIYDEGWQTVRGATLEDTGYMKWAEGQPDGPSSGVEERCGAMSYSGLLNDVECNKPGFFICEHDVDTLASSFDDRIGGK